MAEIYPKVSIIIPIYNAEDYLEECLSSMQNQTYTNIEVLMVDDGSTDASARIAWEYVDIDNRFQYYYQENRGVSAARNLGLDKISGEYITFIDSDDWVDKEYIEKYLSCARNQKADIVVGGYTKDCKEYYNYKTKESDIKNFAENLATGTGGCVWGKLYDASLLKTHRFPVGVAMREDLLFALQVCCDIPQNTIIFYIEFAGYHYRTTVNGLVAQSRDILSITSPSTKQIVDFLLKLKVTNHTISDYIKDIILL
ncbi:MAG: glycosyltransferase family 2 protein, partial [Bacteroidales bacterium]|nr:glycosyltransferase family 2 protein [Bacteroidales bacterium]